MTNRPHCRCARRPSAPKRRRSACAALTLAVAFVLCSVGPHPAAAEAPPVATAPATSEAIAERVALNGSVVAPRTARLSTDIGGIVSRLAVDLGDRVDQGDVLVVLDRDLEAIALESAKAETQAAEAELSDARRRLRVAQPLAARNAIAKNEIDAREAAVAIAEADLARLKAAERRIAERLDRHNIKAPFAGVISERLTEAGEWVSPGTAVMELVDTDRLVVDVPVPQRYFPDLKEAPGITLSFEALRDVSVPAEIEALVPVSDPTARTFTVRLIPRRQGLPLTPGMSARAEMRLAQGREGIVVPRDALIRYPDGRTTVWVSVEEDGRTMVEERQVTLGQSFEGKIHIEDGLTTGDEVVTRGNEALSPGQEVRVTERAGG